MRTWARVKEIQDHAAQGRQPDRLARATRLFVTISRAAGAAGGEVAELVGQRLGWAVFDKNLLDLVVERFHEPRLMLDLVDETSTSWVYDVLGTWMDHHIISHQKFVHQLKAVVRAAARQGRGVFVGRGVQFQLPREKVLAVRITAPERYRIERIARLRGISPQEARQLLRETDRGRREFVEQFFHHDLLDPLLYDLMINVEQLGIQRAVGQIVAALE
jgi:cytidylate kinase